MAPIEINKEQGWVYVADAGTVDFQNVSDENVDIEFLEYDALTPPPTNEVGFSYSKKEKGGYQIDAGNALYVFNRNATSAQYIFKHKGA